jgi:hypothetical protein
VILAVRVALQKAERALVRRVEELEARVQAGEVALWPDYLEAVKALATIAPALAPENGGALLKTEEMAERLGVSVKTLLRKKAGGEIRPAVQKGKHIRWTGRETLS